MYLSIYNVSEPPFVPLVRIQDFFGAGKNIKRTLANINHPTLEAIDFFKIVAKPYSTPTSTLTSRRD